MSIYKSPAGKKKNLALYRVIPRAKRMIGNCSAYVLKGRGHIHFLTDSEKQMIVDFLKK